MPPISSSVAAAIGNDDLHDNAEGVSSSSGINYALCEGSTCCMAALLPVAWTPAAVPTAC